MVAMVTSFQKTVVVSALTLQQDTANPGLCRRLLETHRQVCLNLLWGHCSFLSISCGVTAPFSLSRVGSLLLSLYLVWGHCSFLSISCGVTAPFFWDLVPIKFCLCPPRVYFPVLQKFCKQIPLAFKVKFPGGSQSLCQISRLGNLLWALELLQQCENFFDRIVLQFVGCLLCSSMVD